MERILTSQLSDGVYITREAYLDEKFVLTSPEVSITQELLDRLNEWGFDAIRSDGMISTDQPTFGTSAAAIEDAPLAAVDEGRRDSKEMAATQKTYDQHLRFVEQLFAGFLQHNVLPINPIHARVKSIIESIRERRRYLLRIPQLDPGGTNYIVDHSLKSALIVIAIANAMKMPPHRQMDLGTAALVHEIGMIRLPSALYMTNRELSPRERKAITTHPVLGFKILRQFNFPMQVCLACLECREHVDGSGYPRGLPDNKISGYAKMLAVASTFAAMASPRPYRPAIDGHTVMKTLLQGRGTKFDPDTLKAVVSAFSLFPYGTFVQLASGHRAQVIDIDPTGPRTPLVRIVTDVHGSVVKEQPVVDTKTETYSVTGVLSPDEVARLRASL